MQILLAFVIFVGIFTTSAFASASSWEVEKSVKQYHSQGLIPILNTFKFEFDEIKPGSTNIKTKISAIAGIICSRFINKIFVYLLA